MIRKERRDRYGKVSREKDKRHWKKEVTWRKRREEEGGERRGEMDLKERKISRRR